MLVPAESMTDKFSYSVVLCPFLLCPCFMLNMVIGDIIVTDAGRAGHLLLQATEWSRTWDAWVHRQLG